MGYSRSAHPLGRVVNLLERTGMPARTDHTIATPEAMLTTLAQARERGYVLDDGEQELGVRCVAVPLIGLPFLAAISVSGPSSRVTMEAVPRIAPDRQAVAADIRREYRSADTQNLLQPNNVMNASCSRDKHALGSCAGLSCRV